MDDIGESIPFEAPFVSRHYDHVPATLEELLRVSRKHDTIAKKTDTANVIRERVAGTDTTDNSDSDYQCSNEESDDDVDSSEQELDEWLLHATEPREGLYLQEMRRHRGRMDEKEAQWVRGYIKAQRAWKALTGRSIDEFHTPCSSTRRMNNPSLVNGNRSHKSFTRGLQQEQEQETNASLLLGASCVETILLVAAVVCVCLSVVVHLSV